MEPSDMDKYELEEHFPRELTLRDQFAMAAMEGYLSTEPTYLLEEERESMAFRCYEMADAMLKERDKDGAR